MVPGAHPATGVLSNRYMRNLYRALGMVALLATTTVASADTLRIAVAANFAVTARSLGDAFA